MGQSDGYNQFIRIAGTVRHSSVDGPGIRYVVFFQGCPHHCPGCQNPDTHDFHAGTETTVQSVLEELSQTRFLDGVTLSGGDPLAQAAGAREIARAAHKMGLSVWVYTGWTFEEILAGEAGEEAKRALREIDILVDGRYVEELNPRKHRGQISSGSPGSPLAAQVSTASDNKDRLAPKTQLSAVNEPSMQPFNGRDTDILYCTDSGTDTQSCKYRGSLNQRLIDVQASLQQGKILLYSDEYVIV